MFAKINKGVKTIPSQGYFIKYSGKRPQKSPFKHYFCGKHTVGGAICPNCRKPLLRFALLDSADDRLQLQDGSIGELPLFYCWTCNVAQGDFFYQCLDSGGIAILKYKKGDCRTGFPYEKYPIYFPGRQAYLVEIPDVEQQIITELNAGTISSWIILQLKPHLCRPSHQVGGEPYLAQGVVEKLKCPKCHRAMPFFASIGDDAPNKMSFTGNSFVQVIYHFCKNCFVFGAYHQVD